MADDDYPVSDLAYVLVVLVVIVAMAAGSIVLFVGTH